MISVVFPVYCVENYIADTMNSIAAQTLRDFEVILVDNNSTDNSISIATAVLDEKGIKYKTVCENKQGVSAARNRGIRESAGEWVICIDPDDILAPTFLECLLKNVVYENVTVSCMGFRVVKANNKNEFSNEKGKYVSTKGVELIDSFYAREIVPIAAGMLFQRSFFEQYNVWYNEEMKMGEDAQFVWRVLATNVNIVYDGSPLYNYYVRENSRTTHFSMEKAKSCDIGFNLLHNDLDLTIGVKKSTDIVMRNRFALLRLSAVYGGYQDLCYLSKDFINDDFIATMREYPDARVRLATMLLVYFKPVFFLLEKVI